MKAWVISMTIVLADGTIIKTGHRPRKSSAGYDLASLIVGSEGTLGLVTEAVLKITSAPQNLHVAIAVFSTTHEAVKAAIALIGLSLPIDALELIDKPSMRAINVSGLSDKSWQESPTLFLKFSGSKLAVQSQVELAREAIQKSQCSSFELAMDKSEVEALWAARKTVGVSLQSMKKDPTDLFLSTDTAVPISRLADMIEETHQVIAEAGFLGYTVGHVGDGSSSGSLTGTYPRLNPQQATFTPQSFAARAKKKKRSRSSLVSKEGQCSLKARSLASTALDLN